MITFKMNWNRRNILAAVAAASLGKFWLTTASAQQASAEPIDVEALVGRLSSSSAIDQIRIDVAFIHSWRSVVGPRGYDSDPQWRSEAFSFSKSVFTPIEENPASFVAAAFAEIEESDKLALASFQDNQQRYSEFLANIGIDPGGQAGDRIQRSLREYQALAVSANADVKSARERSYFWPWC